MPQEIHLSRRGNFRQEWQSVDRLDDPQRLVRFIDQKGSGDSDTPESHAAKFRLLGIATGMRILEVGCGLGGLTRALATAVGAGGRAVGTDISSVMVTEARRRALARGVAAEFVLADAANLPFASDTFDACCASGLFEIVSGPAANVARNDARYPPRRQGARRRTGFRNVRTDGDGPPTHTTPPGLHR
jgi:SAM-dependent methyltransferase